MKVGDILTGPQLDGLPVGSVVVYDEYDGSGFNTVTRTSSGFSWTDQHGGRSHHSAYPLGGIYANDWTVVHLPAVPALKVGDVITTEAQARALPIGTVAVNADPEDEPSHSRPAVKDDDGWLFFMTDREAGSTDDEFLIDHKVVYIPARADTGAGSTAA